MKTIWMVGKTLELEDGGKAWMCEGVHDLEADAAKQALEHEFIIEVEMNKPLPVNADDALKLYWPNWQTWETSALYLKRAASKMTG